jgi:glycosyltransferase involved in cell wall biosynthesis
MSMLQYPTNTTHRKLFRKGLPQDVALNEMSEEAVDLGADYILTIDDDTQPPPSVIAELMRVLETSDESVMACGGIYTTKNIPPEPLVYMGFGQGPYWNWRLGEIFPCWAVGNGCLMVRTKLFGMMPRPWYRWIRSVDEAKEFPELFLGILADNPSDIEISPDIFFFMRLEQMGFKVLAHGGVLPVHWDVESGKSYWMPANSPPTEGVKFNGQTFGWTEELCRR